MDHDAPILPILFTHFRTSFSPHNRSRTPFRTLFSSVNVPVPVSSGRPIRPAQKNRAAFLLSVFQTRRSA